jgi:predicted ATPase/tRNA A-37 threonylcarbamoyl transferase component Bud32
MTSGTLDIGVELAGYRIDGMLGRGGMGYVYAAEHVLLGRRAAIKTLHPELLGDEDSKERFIRESRVVASIDHPNIIPIYDAGEAHGVAYIAMRYVQGSDLADLIASQGGLSVDRTLAILDQVGGALDAAHAHEVIHRDVKPANVLIDEAAGRVYLTDFGIAKAVRGPALTQQGMFVGTLDYASPQQIQGQPLGPATDIYALGCVVYECLTGAKPFPLETDVAVMYAHLLEVPPKVTAAKPELPEALDDVIARAMAKSEEERYHSCRELVDAARAALTGGAVPRAVAASTPRPSAARLVASNLPAVSTPLVGRERELNAVSELLRRDDVRLVTLVGIGGTGKTRLALELGATLGPEFGNVLFVDLAPITDPTLVGTAIAEALGVGEARDQPLLETIRARIGDDPMLLVLDNFEQVVDASPFVADLLGAAPTLNVLATSQAALRVRGEHEFPVPPLSLPDPGDADSMAESAAVALFVERAQSVRPNFELTEENRAAVAEICVHLDGLPLAIELAAARVKLLTPQAMLSRLERRFDLLTGGAVDLPERQQTLRNAIDWSYDLLSEDEKKMFSRLGVFVGGCALEAAEAVCGAPEGLGIGDVIDLVASLVDKSLVRQLESSDGEPRFNMLETIREYALTRLEERGELEDLQRRHAERFLQLAETAEPELVRAGQSTWLQRLDEENGNIRAALAWSLRTGDVELGLRMAGALVRFWSTRGHMAEGRRWLTDAMERASELPAPVLAKAYYAAGYSALGQGDYVQAKPFFEESLRLAREAGDIRLEAASLQQLGFLVMARGEYVDDAEERAGQLAEKSLELARAVGDKLTASGALNILADRASAGGRNTEAMELFQEGLTLRRELGDKRLVANSLLNLGRTELTRGQYARATELLEEGLALAREVRDTWSMSVALVNLGRVRLSEDETDEGQRLFTEALKLAKDRGDKRVAAEALQGLGAASAQNGDGGRAVQLFSAAEAMLESIGATASAAERLITQTYEAPLRERLGDDAWQTQQTVGRSLSPEDAIALGLT